MRRGTLLLLLFIVLLAVGAAYVDFWPHVDTNSTSKPLYGINNPFIFKEGLDLQGGVSVLLKPDPSQHYTKAEVDANIDNTLNQIERRVNGGLGVNEPVIRKLSDSQGNQSIALDLPGLNQPDAVNTLLRPGKLEFWDTGTTPATTGTALDPTQYTQYNPGNKPLFTGADLDPNQISVGTQQDTGQIVINFEMKGDAISRFGEFTGKHIGDYLTITLDRKVISSAVIQSQINGPGIIQGTFTQTQAQSIVTVLQYGALPLALVIDSCVKRALPSIRGSNISTLITCAVLFYFGSNFGASLIVGFATNLFLGVVISMFTAITVTRTFLNLLVPTGVINHPALFGLPVDAIPTTSLMRRNSTV